MNANADAEENAEENAEEDVDQTAAEDDESETLPSGEDEYVGAPVGFSEMTDLNHLDIDFTAIFSLKPFDNKATQAVPAGEASAAIVSSSDVKANEATASLNLAGSALVSKQIVSFKLSTDEDTELIVEKETTALLKPNRNLAPPPNQESVANLKPLTELTNTKNFEISSRAPETRTSTQLGASPSRLPPATPTTPAPSGPEKWTLEEVTRIGMIAPAVPMEAQTIDVSDFNSLPDPNTTEALSQAENIDATYSILEKANSIEVLAEACFKLMSQYFSESMLLTFQDQEFRPNRWTPGWNAPQIVQGIQLLQPSVFSIVFKTAMPFHGAVHSSPVNDHFFKHWNRGSLPEHLTITPIRKDQKLFGILLGIQTGHRANNRYTFQFMEDLGDRTMAAVQRIKLKAA